MMITAKIGQVERQWGGLDDVEESWIAQQITRLQHAGEPVCVRVGIATLGVHVVLTAGQCAPGFGGGRPPNEHERQVFDLWNELVKQNGHINPGDIIAFLHRLRRII